MSHYFTEADGQAYPRGPGSINLGLAVDVERKDGSRFLVVPVIKGADELDFRGFHARYEELVEAPGRTSCRRTTSSAPPSRSPTRARSARPPACRG